MIRDIDEKLTELEAALQTEQDAEKLSEMKKEVKVLLAQSANLSAHDRVYLARHRKRPKVDDYINAIFDDFFEEKGDYLGKEDKSIYGGIALFHDIPVTVIGHRKGRNITESMEYNFGMPEPEGYRKALRLMKQAEKFNRPIITFVNTPGAFPGMEAEENGQGEAIARNLYEMSALKVPVLSLLIGEGGSGGDLALAC